MSEIKTTHKKLFKDLFVGCGKILSQEKTVFSSTFQNHVFIVHAEK